MKQKYRSYTPILLFAILLVLSFFILRPFLSALFLGAVLAYVTRPLYFFFIQRTSLKKGVAAFLVCVGVLLVLLIPGIFLVRSLAHESYVIFLGAKQFFAQDFFTQCDGGVCGLIQSFLDNPGFGIQVQEVLKSVATWLVEKGSSVLFSIPNLLLNLFVIFFSLYYFLRDGDALMKRVGSILSMNQTKYATIISRLQQITNGLVYGYILVALLQGLLGGIGFFLFGISSPIFWGAMMALFALIPFLGTPVIWLPAVLLMVIEGIFIDSSVLIWKGIALGLYSLLLVSSLDNIIKPKIMGTKAKVHPAVVLLGILGGLFFFGTIGVLVGPLVLALVVVFIDVYILEKKAA